AGPEAIEGRQMRLVELPRARGPEALPRVREVPHVEIRDLRPFDRDDPDELAGAYRPRPPRAHRHHEALDELAMAALAAEPRVELAVRLERRARLGLVDHAWSRHVLTSYIAVDNDASIIVSYRPVGQRYTAASIMVVRAEGRRGRRGSRHTA